MSGITPQQRAGDRAWLRENFEVLRDAARRGYKQSGRGAIFVQATRQPVPGKGNPMYWLTAAQVERSGDADVIRMVNRYDPRREFVVIVDKSAEGVSTYQLGVEQFRGWG